jgi:nucleoside-diphosphate-sugar epimerase
MADPEVVLLTGATGFIGSHLARLLLNHGITVHAPVRPGTYEHRLARLRDEPLLNLHELDLSDHAQVANWVARNRIDACIHLAWAHGSPEASFAFSANLLEAAVANRCPRVVLAGSCFEYDVTGNTPLSEESPTKPQQATDAAKLDLERFLQAKSAGSATTPAMARLFYVYGPGQPERHLVPHVTTHLLAGEPAQLTAGTQQKDYLHVEDVAAGLWAMACADVQGIVNIGSGHAVAVAQVATKIGEILQRGELLRFGELPPRRHDPDFVCANNRKLLDSTAWHPQYDLDHGLRNTVEWWQHQTARSGV